MTNRKIDASWIALAAAIVAAIFLVVANWNRWMERGNPLEDPLAESKSSQSAITPAPNNDFNVTAARKSVVFIKNLTPGLSPGFGSGFLVSSDGLIYTNRHVVKPDQPIRGSIVLVGVPSAANPEQLDFFKAEVVYATPNPLDFAVLKVAAREGYGPFPALPVTNEIPELASSVAVIGYPFINENQRVLAFNKGSISATRVVLEGRAFCQTDAAFNPGNSGGPLLNLRGQAIGIATMRKVNSAGMNYALQLKEVEAAVALAKGRVGSLRPELGPLDPHNLPSLPSIPPVASAWDIVRGDALANGGILSVHNKGGPYWIATKDDLPENFQIVMTCMVEELLGPHHARVHNDNRRSLCVRFGTEDVGKDIIMDSVGTRLQFREQESLVWQEKQLLSNGLRGCPDDPFVLTVSRQRGIVTVAVDDDIIFRSIAKPGAKQPTKLSIGGTLSRLNLGEVSIIQLEPGPGGKYRRIVPKATPLVRGSFGPPIIIPPNSPPPLVDIDVTQFGGDLVEKPIDAKIADVAVGGGGRFLVLHLPAVPELAIFDVSLAKVVGHIKLAEANAKYAVGLDKVVVALPASKKIERWDLLSGNLELTRPLPIKGPLTLAAMGSASRGPILLGAGDGPLNSESVFVDVHNLKALDFKRAGQAQIQIDKNVHVSASADGASFAASSDASPGITTLVLSGNEARGHFTKEGVGSLPAVHGNYSLRFNPREGSASIHLVGYDGPIASIAKERLGVDLNDHGLFPAAKRVHLIPSAKVIVTIPASNDKIVMHRFDADAALEKSAVNYLYVTSSPPIWGRKGAAYQYRMTVESRTGDLKFHVVAGPPGLTVLKTGPNTGLITWAVPSTFADNECEVVIAVSDQTRQEVQHAFKIALRGERPKVVNAEE